MHYLILQAGTNVQILGDGASLIQMYLKDLTAMALNYCIHTTAAIPDNHASSIW